jgi:hypothetical protein
MPWQHVLEKGTQAQETQTLTYSNSMTIFVQFSVSDQLFYFCHQLRWRKWLLQK